MGFRRQAGQAEQSENPDDKMQGEMVSMLNSNASRPARVQFLPGSFRLLSPGDHVVCAVSGVKIPLQDLRYWNADAQEAYASAEIATKRFAETQKKAD